jgi:holo-[acyl-carrier protein] synthase
VATAPAAERPESTLRVGVDVVGVKRLEALVHDDERRQQELFTPRELAYCHGKRRCYEHMAARFAAKEAVLKAFGTGISQRMRWTEVEVVNEQNGRPRIRLDGAVASFARDHGLTQLDVSLSHTEGLAIAQAVSLWRGRPAEGVLCAST